MFAVPKSVTGGGLVAYAAVLYITWGITYTMMDIPFWSMIPAFTEGGKERENLSTLARSCAGVGSAIITVITMICVPMLGRIGNSDRAVLVDAGNAAEASDAVKLAGLEAGKLIERDGFKWFTLIVAILLSYLSPLPVSALRKIHGEYAVTDSRPDVQGSLFQ